MAEVHDAGPSEADVRGAVQATVLRMAPEPGSGRGIEELIGVLGYHSLALLELAFALEEQFRLPPIDPETATRLRTGADLQDYVVGELRGSGRLG